MSHEQRCPACQQSFDGNASRFPPMTVEGMSVFVCGVCTCVCAEAASRRVDDHYRARVWGGPPRAEFYELDDGTIRPSDTETKEARDEAKLQALRAALRVGNTLSASVLQVGCRTGDFLEGAQERFGGLGITALEPWRPWRDAAAERGLSVVASTAEDFEGSTYDIVVEFDLLDHFADPVAHLRALSDLVRPGGHLLLGVSNIAACAGLLHPHKLRLDAPIGFTRKALRRACAAAGLSAAIWEDGASLFAVCERGNPIVQDAAPTEAAQLVLALRENDGRLLLKRVLAEHGPTDAVLRAAEAAVRGCRTAEGRRSLCEDVARVCERGLRHDAAAQWFERGRMARRSASQDVA